MPMSQENQQAVVNYLMTRVPRYACTFCGGQRFSATELVPLPVLGDPNGCLLLVTVTCGDCARVELFDAHTVGLRPPFV
jgi:hypothetical protein